MLMRYIGAVLIFASCGSFGFLLAANYRREERCLAELLRLLERMQNELSYRLTPLPQICANIAQTASGCLSMAFKALAGELEGQNAPDAAQCMKNAVKTAKDTPKPVEKLLLLLGDSLGEYDLQGQLNELSAVKCECQSLLEQMRQQQDMRLRSYRTLGLCVGAGLAVLFL